MKTNPINYLNLFIVIAVFVIAMVGSGIYADMNRTRKPKTTPKRDKINTFLNVYFTVLTIAILVFFAKIFQVL